MSQVLHLFRSPPGAPEGLPDRRMADTGLDPLPALHAALKEAQHEAETCADDAARRRAELVARIGDRGLTIGSVTLPDGRTVPIVAGHEKTVRALWRRLPADQRGERQAMSLAVRDACRAWDAEASRAGIPELEERATAARRRARALLRQLGDTAATIPAGALAKVRVALAEPVARGEPIIGGVLREIEAMLTAGGSVVA